MMLSYFHIPVSHMTGAFSHLSMVVGAEVDLKNFYLSLGIVMAFLAGSILTGILIGKENIIPENNYSKALLIEALILLIAHLLIQMNIKNGIVLAALGCGIQNALATTYLGLNIRTTHVSGIVTDLGLSLGHWFRGHSLDSKKVLLFFSLLSGFFIGGVIAALLYIQGGKVMMVIPALIAFFIALAYLILKRLQWLTYDKNLPENSL